MNGQVKFDYAEVEQCCNELFKLLEELKEVDEQFKTSARKIEDGSIWKGKASERFAKKCQGMSRPIKSMEESLKNSILYIISCSERYSDSESVLMQEIRNMLSEV